MNLKLKGLHPVLVLLTLRSASWPAVGDETKYFPDNVQAVMSCDTKKASTIIKEVMSSAPENVRPKWLEFAGRFTLAIADSDEIVIVAAAKAVTLAEQKVLMTELYKGGTGKHTIKEIKHGGHSILQNEFENIGTGPASFLAEGKYLVMGQMPILKNIIDRNSSGKKSAPTNLKAGLDVAGFDNGATLVVDVQSLTKTNKKGAFDAFGGLHALKDIKANFPNVRHFAVKLNEKEGKVSVSAALICDNDKSAAALKSITEESTKFVPKRLIDIKEDAMFTKKEEEMKRQALVTLFQAIKVSSTGNQVVANFEVGTDNAISAARGLDLLFVVLAIPAPKKER